MTRKSTDETARLSDDWQKLVERGQAPGMAGRSAEEARRDQARQRPLTPSERRRRQKRLSLTVGERLVAELRRICAERGYVNADGAGQLASPVIENLLWLAVAAYRDGLIEHYEEQTVTTVDRLRWKA